MYSETWLLYLGNALFLFYIFIFGIFYSKRPGSQTLSLNSGLAVTFDGIFFSCVLVVLSILVFAPGLFGIGSSDHILKNTPAALPDNHSHGIIFIIFASATIGNFAAGSFSSILSAAATKRINEPGK
jgi:hypothetical protein